MIVNSRIHNLHKAIDWIEKQLLGLRYEVIIWIKRKSIGSNRLETQAIDWNKIQSLGNQAIDWNSFTFIETCSDGLNGVKLIFFPFFFLSMLKII